MAEGQDTEITLGTGRLLGLFFGLAVVCAVFFGMGFAMGKSSGGPAPIIDASATMPAVSTTGGAKPAASKAVAKPAACPEGQTCDSAPSTSDELAFIKSGDAKPDAPPDTEPAAETPAAPAVAAKAAPEMKSAPPQSGFVVQIAAVSKKDDADALVGALRKRSYPVFVAGDASDHLFHVQVGPFSDRRDAQTMRDRLAGDGYNPIVK